MQGIEVSIFGGPEVLELRELAVRDPAPDEVVIEVRAIGVNPVETYIRAGTYPVLPALPYVPGGNCSGVVAEVGSAVTTLKVGDRVYTAASAGAYAEYCCCRASQVYPLPVQASYAQGAAVGVPAATAHRALFLRGGAVAGETVLVHGASGSVGQAAVQLALAAGLTVVGTAGTEQGAKVLGELGAHKVVRHDTPSYTEQLAAIAPAGYGLILEMLANINLERDLELLAPRGRVVVIGSRGRVEIDPRATMGKETEIRGLALANGTEEELRETHAALYRALAEGILVPRIAEYYPLAEAATAHRRVLEGGVTGKIILLPPGCEEEAERH